MIVVAVVLLTLAGGIAEAATSAPPPEHVVPKCSLGGAEAPNDEVATASADAVTISPDAVTICPDAVTICPDAGAVCADDDARSLDDDRLHQLFESVAHPRAVVDPDAFRCLLGTVYKAFQRASEPWSPLRRVSLRCLLSELRLPSPWHLLGRPSRTAVIRALLRTESVPARKLAAVLLRAMMSRTRSAAVAANLVPEFLLATISEPLFFPVHLRFLSAMPDCSLPPYAILGAFYRQFVLARVPPGLIRATDVTLPGSRLRLDAEAGELWRQLVRCSTTGDVQVVTLGAVHDLSPHPWSILFFEAAARLCLSGLRLHVIVSDNDLYQRHVFAEAVARAYPTDGPLWRHLSAWSSLSSPLDSFRLGITNAHLLAVVVEWVDHFFSEYPRPLAPEYPRFDSLQRLLSHLDVPLLENVFNDVVGHDEGSRMSVALTSQQAGENDADLDDHRRSRERDARFLDLAGPLHFLLMARTELYPRYARMLQRCPIQCYRTVLAIGFWMQPPSKWDPNFYLRDAYMQYCVLELSKSVKARDRIFYGHDTDRPALISALIAAAADHLTLAQLPPDSAQVEFHSTRYPSPLDAPRADFPPAVPVQFHSARHRSPVFLAGGDPSPSQLHVPA